VDVFGFVSWSVTIIVAVTLALPVNILLMALAFKIRHGGKPIDMEGREFWTRCTLASLGLAGMSLVLLGLTYLLVQSVEMPQGPVQTTLLVAYVAAAVGYLFWVLALEDMVQALGAFLLYILLPGFPLLLIGRLTHLWDAVKRLAPWLLQAS
jgi:hypothetical protein